MTLDRFLGLLEGEIKRFETYWRKGHKEHAESFPLEMLEREWRFYLDELTWINREPEVGPLED